jgi:predicted ArsR family transcriptional regulator
MVSGVDHKLEAPRQRTRRTIIDCAKCRVTVRDGKRYPLLFGTGATPILMYVALNPRRSAREICEYLDISAGAFQQQIHDRLGARRLIVDRWASRGSGRKHRYVINPGLSAYNELRDYLRVLGAIYGMERTHARARARSLEKGAALALEPMPLSLFWTPNRTTILGFVASLGEVYAQEAFEVLPMVEKTVRGTFFHLVAEGVLRVRVFKQTKLYSLDRRSPGAAKLRKLSRKIVSERHDLQMAALQALVRRKIMATQYTIRERSIIDEIRHGRNPKGVRAYLLRSTVA